MLLPIIIRNAGRIDDLSALAGVCLFYRRNAQDLGAKASYRRINKE
jgi:hypothetical protein